jgi:hypothetical protein
MLDLNHCVPWRSLFVSLGMTEALPGGLLTLENPV